MLTLPLIVQHLTASRENHVMSRGKGGNRRIHTVAEAKRDVEAALIAQASAPFAMRSNPIVTDADRERAGLVRAFVADGSGAHMAWVEMPSC